MASETELKVLPPPMQNETFGASKKRHKVIKSGHAKRPVKGLVQFNVKVRARVRERFEEVVARSGITKGELLEQFILMALEGDTPSPADAAEGRTTRMVVHAVPALAEVLSARVATRHWTLSETIEHACAVARKVEGAATRDGVDLDDWLQTARAAKQ